MEGKLDPARYLEVISRTIDRLDVPVHIRDEAYSEGLVALVQAASSFNPDMGVLPNTWLYFKVRYVLLTWLKAQRRHETVNLDDVDHEPAVNSGSATDEQAYFTQVVETSLTMLSYEEHLAVVGYAYGLRRNELRRSLKITDRRLKYLRARGQRKLRHRLGLL